MAKNAATEGALGDLHDVLATVLIQALRDPNLATAAVMNAARGFLKDNDITCRVDDGNKLGELARELDAQGPQAVGTTEDHELDEALADVLDMEKFRGRA